MFPDVIGYYIIPAAVELVFLIHTYVRSMLI